MGGSGKQSLTRLAAFVSGLEVFQIQLRKGYGVGDLKVSKFKGGCHDCLCVTVVVTEQICLINDLFSVW